MKTKTANAKAAAPAKKRTLPADSGPLEVTRHITSSVECLLWGRAAARCEFWGCNKPLWKSSVTQESVNLAQKAHIYSFSAGGPRGHKGITRQELNDFGNLLLVCHGCHQKIDKHNDGGRYTADLLRQWKAEHERRIEIVTGIDPSKRSHVILYGANVGSHSSPLTFDEAAHALFPTLHPADDRAITLGMINSSFSDRSDAFWKVEAEQLVTTFGLQVKERIRLGTIEHLSIFAIAPQPLLILLGSLINNISKAEIYQRHREPQTWQWPAKAPKLGFQVEAPAATNGTPALVIALSATVTDDRITDILPDANIWRVSVSKPNMDLIKSRAQLSEFRTVLRTVLDRIKAAHGQATQLHVFPVVGVAPAIEIGRVRMPKADMPWQVYDQVNARGGFIPALSLSKEE